MTNRLTILSFLALACAAAPAYAKAPRVHKEPVVIEGVIDHFIDGDSYWLTRKDGSKIKLREWVEDAPEVAHNKSETDQPGGQEALKYATDHYKGKQVTVTVKGHSYDRIVGQTFAKGATRALGLDLVSSGHALVYPKSVPRPPAAYLDAEKAALEKRIGIFHDTVSPVAPWDWRKQSRDKQK